MSRRRTDPVIVIPIMGVIRAGHPIPLPDAGTPPLDFLEVPRSAIVPACGIFGLRVRGDSMVDARVYDGDTIIIKPQNTAANGDLIVARVHNDPTNPETTFKRFFYQGDLVYLQPENSSYRALIVEPKDVEVIGVVVAVWRKSAPGERRVEMVA